MNRSGKMTNYFIKKGYKSRDRASNLLEQDSSTAEKTHQPHVYELAESLANKLKVKTILDIGCGRGTKLLNFAGKYNVIGIDSPYYVKSLNQEYPHCDWYAVDLNTARDLPVSDSVIDNSLVICADVIEHLLNPENLLKRLKKLSNRAKAIILSTPERNLV